MADPEANRDFPDNKQRYAFCNSQWNRKGDAMNKVRRFDQISLRPNIERTPEGYLKGDAIVTRTGIFLYKNPDGTIRKELRHPRDVFSSASMATLRMLPIVSGHPDELFVTAENAKDLQVGSTGENYQVDGDYIICPLIITDKTAIESIEQGRRELSLGYEISYADLDGGEWEGEHYDLRQIEIRYNHLAIVDLARAGAMARLNLDSTDAILVNSIDSKRGDGIMSTEKNLRQIIIDGISYEAAPEVINALEKANKRADELQEKLDSFVVITLDGDQKAKAEPAVQVAMDKQKGELDGVKQKLEDAKKLTSDEAVRELVKKRQQIIDSARRVLDEDTIKKLDEMNDSDIMKEIIIQSAPQDKSDALRDSLKDSSEGYIEGRYAQIVDGLPPEKKDSTIAGQRAASTNQPRGDEKPVSEKDARKKYVDGLETAWQNKKES